MKHFFIITLILLSSNIWSQLVQEDNQWNIAVYPTFSPSIKSYSIKIGEDTIANDLTYHKVYMSRDSLGSQWHFTSQLLRQESSQVYLKEKDNAEDLFYDFSLMVGDSFYVNAHCILSVIAVDSITLINGDIRKRLLLERKNNTNWGTQYWIAGIGSEYGVMSHWNYCATDYADGLLCHYSKGQLLYPETPASCFITNVNDITDSALTLYPNPCINHITIETESAEVSRYQIYSYNGTLITDGIISHNRIFVNTSAYESGIYILVVQSKNQNMATLRFVKL